MATDIAVEGSATIYDVAKAAGVAPSTVSRTFSRPGRVSSRTAQRVREVAESLGYRTEPVYTPIARTQTRVIALVVSDLTDPAHFGIVRGAEQAAAKAGYTLLMMESHESSRVERGLFERTAPMVDGLIITSSQLSDTELRTLAKTVPVVVVNRHVGGLPSIVPDSARGVRRALEHLGELGHRRVAYVSGSGMSWADGVRWRSVREASLELNLTETRLGPTPPTVAGGERLAGEFIGSGCTAAVCFSDLIALGLTRGLKERGLGVPRDASVVGFDNIFASDMVAPSLTTVAAPMATLGEVSVNHIINTLSRPAQSLRMGQQRPPQPRPGGAMVVPVRLMVRESTGPVPARG